MSRPTDTHYAEVVDRPLRVRDAWWKSDAADRLLLRAFERPLQNLPPASRAALEHALLNDEPSMEDALQFLRTILASADFVAQLEEGDPLADAKRRGREEFKELLAAEGGLLSSQELADAAGVSRQTVHSRQAKGQLFSVGSGDRRYPAWQVHKTKWLAGLPDVLEVLDRTDPSAVLSFFLSPSERLGGRSPLVALREQGERAVAAVQAEAARFGEHGAQ